MTVDSFDWDEELAPETEEEVYRALLRALRRKQGFGLFFVQCTKAQGEKIVADLRRDLSQQKIEELHLQGEVVTLYDSIAELWNQQRFDVLAIEGLQDSLYAYEDTKRFSGWSSEDFYHYSWKGVPQILNHLNQQREHLRNDFPVRLVFLVPAFVVDYFIQRAADFLDWRSGLFRFPADPKEVVQDAERFVVNGGFTAYQALTPQERIEKILHLKTALQEVGELHHHKMPAQSYLLLELGLLFAAEQDYGNAITSLKKALAIKPDNHIDCCSRGIDLSELGHNEEAIVSYDQALKYKPDYHTAWYGRGLALSLLGRNEEAIASYDQALKYKPDYHQAWYDRGYVLSALGRNEEAIASYDQALKYKPDDHLAWYNKACCYGLRKQIDLAIAALQQAILLDSKYRELAKTDANFDLIRQDDRFQALLNSD